MALSHLSFSLRKNSFGQHQARGFTAWVHDSANLGAAYSSILGVWFTLCENRM
ncbi:hypothetical protein ACU8KH_05328 [Lachancea thermotolerans]